MSSILEALKELEGNKPSSHRSRAAWASGADDERTPLRRSAEVLGIVAFGLALGGAAFGLYVWLGGTGERATAPAAVPPGASRPTPAPPAAAPLALPRTAPTPPAPAWLSRMGAPRGRVADDADGASGPRTDEPAPRAAGLSLVRVHYGSSRGERTATLRIDGSPVVLHEGETTNGIELQLVTPTGAYVRRGGEVLMLEQPR